MCICKVTEVRFCMSVRKYHDITLAENETGAYTPCLRPHKKLILTAIHLKFSQTNNKIVWIRK